MKIKKKFRTVCCALGMLLALEQSAVAVPAANDPGTALPAKTEEVSQTAKTEESDSGKAVLSLSAEGNTVYVDTEGTWSSLEGQLVFDGANQTAKYGATQELTDAALDQQVMSLPVFNMQEGNFIFVAVYSALSGQGIDYTGHALYVTFKEINDPITVTLQDLDGNVLETVVADGAATSLEKEEETKASASPAGKEQNRLWIWTAAVLAAIVIVAAVLLLILRSCSKKKKDPRENSENPEKTQDSDGQEMNQ